MQALVELYQHAQALPAALGARILPGKEERAPSPAPDHGSTGADVSITQGTCMDTPRAVPGPAFLPWSTISPNPNPSPCAGDALGVCPIPTPNQELWVLRAIPAFYSQGSGLGNPVKGLVLEWSGGAGGGSGGAGCCGCPGAGGSCRSLPGYICRGMQE